jgi:HAD superfamily hydrolase (TIGR01509 family)
MAAPGIKAVIFDCFGVLYTDSKRSLLDIVPANRRQELHDLFTSNNYGYFDKRTYLSQVAEIVGRSEKEIADYVAHEHQLNTTLTTLIREELKPAYKVGLLSNIGREWMDDFFSKHQLHELFDEVVLSGEEGVTKPSPVIFELMASRLGLSTNECLMIDDILENCEGEERAGMESIHYTSNTELLDYLYHQGILH